MRAVAALFVCLCLLPGCGESPPPEAEPAAAPAPPETAPPKPAAPPPAPPEPVAPAPADPEPADPEPADPEPAEPTAPEGFLPTPPAFDGLPLTARLPADALGLLAVGSPVDLARRVGWTPLLDALGPSVARDRAEVRGLLGHDLFDPAAWKAAGVDPGRPAGVALLSIEPPIVAITVSLADRETLRTVLLALAAGVLDVKHTTEGDLSLLYTAEFAVGLTAGEGWLVFGDGLMPGEALHHARALARPAEQRLIERPELAPVIARLNYGRDAAAVVNVPAIIDAALRRGLNLDGAARIERRLRGATALGEQAEVARLSAELKQARSRGPEGGPGRLAVGMVLRAYLAPFGGLAVGLNIEPAGPQLRFAHRLDLDSPVGRVITSRPGPLALRAAFPRGPVGLVEANVDPGAAWELIRALGAALGGSRELSALDRMAQQLFGRDVAGLLSLCAGDLGVTAEADPERLAGIRAPEELLTRMRFAGHIGLTDAAAAAELLDGLAGEPELGLVAAPAAGPGGQRVWRLGIDARLTLWIGLGGPELYLALDEPTLRRLLTAPAERPGFVAELKPAPRAMLDGRDGGWSAWLDLAGLGPLMMGRTPAPGGQPPPGPDPISALRAQIGAIEQKIDRAHADHRAGEVRRGRLMLSALGHATASVSRVPGGLAGRAGLYVGAPDTAAAALTLARTIRAEGDASRALWSEILDPLYDQKRALDRQLDDLVRRSKPAPATPRPGGAP